MEIIKVLENGCIENLLVSYGCIHYSINGVGWRTNSSQEKQEDTPDSSLRLFRSKSFMGWLWQIVAGTEVSQNPTKNPKRTHSFRLHYYCLRLQVNCVKSRNINRFVPFPRFPVGLRCPNWLIRCLQLSRLQHCSQVFDLYVADWLRVRYTSEHE